MHLDRWLDTKVMIKEKFEVLEEEKESLPEELGGGELERLIFNGPLGKIKLEFVTRPLVMGKKTTGSRRSGSETHVDYIYSATETTHRFTAWRWVEGLEEWEELKSDIFGG